MSLVENFFDWLGFGSDWSLLGGCHRYFLDVGSLLIEAIEKCKGLRLLASIEEKRGAQWKANMAMKSELAEVNEGKEPSWFHWIRSERWTVKEIGFRFDVSRAVARQIQQSCCTYVEALAIARAHRELVSQIGI